MKPGSPIIPLLCQFLSDRTEVQIFVRKSLDRALIEASIAFAICASL
jgi:hypothetical protein